MSAKTTPHKLGALAVAGLGLVCTFNGLTRRAATTPAEPENAVRSAYGRLPMAFEPNRGQTAANVRYTARGEGYGLYLTSNEAVLTLSKPQAKSGERAVDALRMTLKGANPNSKSQGVEPLAGRSNYFIGADASQWVKDVPHFGKVRYDEVYPGIDVVYYGNQRRLEYDFVVAPGASPAPIRMSYAGQKGMRIAKDGSLTLETATGAVRQEPPVVYQETNGKRRRVSGEYVLLADNQVGFRLGEYDHSRELVIDPVVNYSTYFGGSALEQSTDVVVDTDGNAYVTGVTSSNDFPILNSPPNSPRGANFDAFVFKLNADGSGVVYATYFGGAADENIDTGTGETYGSIAIDSTRNAYITGYTNSTNIPTVQPIQTSNAGNGDAFVLKLNPQGNGILWSTYLGGRGQDGANGIAVDAAGNSYIAGQTSSPDFNLRNARQPVYAGGTSDAFVTRINSEGTGLVYSTYLGGQSADRANGIAVDPIGNLAVTGITLSTNFPTTAGSFQPNNQGSSDAFIVKYNPVASDVIYASYLGGSGENTGTGVALDDSGNAYVTGYTTSTDFPTTAGAFDVSWNGGISDGFVAKINATGTDKTYCTYIGGDGEDIVNRIAVSVTGNNSFLAYVTGQTTSTNLPVEQAVRTSLFGGIDAFVTKLNVSGSALEYSTYYGGSGDDTGTGIAVDGTGRAYVVGTTTSSDFVRILPWDASLNGGSDSFLTRLISPPAAPSDLVAVALSSTEVDLSWSDNSDNEVDFVIERRTLAPVVTAFAPLPVTIGSNTTTYLDAPVTPDTTYVYRVRTRNAVGGSAFSNAVEVTTPPLPPTAPTGLSVTPLSQTSLRVQWTDTSSNEDEFHVERSTNNITFTDIATVAAAPGTGSTVTFDDTPLLVFRTYYYRVRGRNAGGFGPYSAVAFGTTMDNPPAAPTSLSAETISNTEILLIWTLNGSNETGVTVERSDDGVTFNPIASLAAGTDFYLDGGLQPETLYTYRVYASNSGGPSGMSNEASATTYPDPPAAPLNLALTVLSQTAIRLEWTDGSDSEEGFRVERSDDGGATFAPVATVGAVAGNGSTITYTDGTLSANTTYYYVVYAFNLGGDSASSNVENATTLPNPPAAPSVLRVSAVSQTSLQLFWIDNANNEDNYYVERSQDGASFALVQTLPANTEQYQDNGLAAATTYFYRVRAGNAGGFSGYTVTQSATTLPNPPSAPTGLIAALAGKTRIDLSWTDASNNESGFKVERSTDGVNYVQVAQTGAGVAVYSDLGLAPDTTYRYRVRATNAGGDSAYSNTTSATTVPAAPSSLNTTVLSSSSVRLLWIDNSTTETNFHVERRTANTQFARIATLGGNVNTFLDQGLVGATTYTYRVIASSGAGESDPSNDATALTLPNPPASPSGLVATAISQTQIDLDWTDNSTNETNFRLERSTAQNGTFFQIALLGPGIAEFSDTGLALNTTYFYRVVAVNTGGDSAPSNVASATTYPAAPSGPTGLTATAISADSIRLNWQDNANNEQGYRVEQSEDGATFREIFSGSSPDQITHTVSGLDANNRYHFRVRGYNLGGNSGYSNNANALTLPAAPVNLTAEGLSSGQIRLKWAHSHGADGYHVEARFSTAPDFGQVAILGANATTFVHSNILPNRTFVYRVRAFNRSGNSAYSNEAQASTVISLESLTLTPNRVRGGRRVTAVVRLNGPAPKGGTTVSITTSVNTAIVPKTVRILAGNTSANFFVRTRRPRGSVLVTISATAGTVTRSAELTVTR